MAPLDGPGLRALEPLMQGWSPEGWMVEKPRSANAAEQLPLFE
jgi:hypothetical protein